MSNFTSDAACSFACSFMNNSISTTSVIGITAEQHRGVISIFTIVCFIIAGLAIIGNSTVIYIALKSKSMRKQKANMLIVSQSIFDLISGVCIIMYVFPYNITKNSLYDALCKLFMSGFAMDSFMCSSTYNIILLTIEKYTLVVYPLKHRIWFTADRIAYFIVFALASGPVIPLSYMIPAEIVHQKCHSLEFLPEIVISLIGLAKVLILSAFPILFIVYSYTKMYLTLRQRKTLFMQSNQQQSMPSGRVMSQSETNALKTMALVGACYCFCYLPTIIGVFMYMSGNELGVETIIKIVVGFSFFNCAINPFVYALKYERFKKEVSKQFMIYSCRLCINRVQPLESH